MADAKTNCPKCGGHIAFPKELAGQETVCPHCAETIVLRKSKRATVYLVSAVVTLGAVCIIVIYFWQHHAKAAQVAKYLHSPINVLKADAAKGNPIAQVALGWRYYNGQGVATNLTEAANWWSKAAENGDAESQFRMGCIYQFGEGVSEDSSKAFQWFLKSAQNGYAKAQFRVAEAYGQGLGVVQDKAKADRWNAKAAKGFIKAAERGDELSRNLFQYQYLSMFSDTENLGKETRELLFKWALKSARQGSADAQLVAANAYEKGLGVATNTVEATKWYTKAFNSYTEAAKKGDASAQKKLGDMYMDGMGVGKHPSEAIKWYTKAAQQNNADAQQRLGWMYQRGEGVTKNFNEAVKWYIKAAEAGYQSSYLTYMSTEDREQLEQDTRQLYFNWLLKSAQQGDTRVQYEVAEAYASGFGVVQDKQEAFNWYLKAAKMGNEFAQYEVGEFYAKAGDTAENHIEACKWLSLAAEHDKTQSWSAAKYDMDNVAKLMTAEELAEASRRAKEFLSEGLPTKK